MTKNAAGKNFYWQIIHNFVVTTPLFSVKIILEKNRKIIFIQDNKK